MVFTSCEKEQDELIIGTWTAEISEDYKEYENGELIYSDIDTFTETWTFQKNGQLLVNYEGKQDTYTYSVQGDKLQTTYAQDFSEEKDYFSSILSCFSRSCVFYIIYSIKICNYE